MDAETEIKKQVNPFYCNICKIWCASALNLQTHFLGVKHKTVEEALKAHGIVKTASGSGEQVKTPVKLLDYVQTEPERFHGQTLEEQLNTCKDSEPALGLNYIVEYRSKDNFPFLYECQLCYCKTGLNNMFMHVCGYKHRLAYLKQHYPEIAESDEVKGKGSELNRKVRQVALTIEKKEGRKQIKVVTDAPTMRRRWQEFKTASGSGEQVKTPVKLPDYVQTEPERFHGQTLEEQLNTCKDSEPALGLNYIVEYRSKDNFPFLYECQLCYCKTGLNSMFMHVCGSKHRLAYLKQHYPEIAESDEVKGKGSELNRKVRQVALTIEKKEGRKQIKVVTDAPTMRRRWQEYSNTDDSPSKAKVQHVDASLSNANKADSKNTDGKLPEPIQDGNNVQEEKEESQKEQAQPHEKVKPNKAIESSKENNSERCETDEQLQEENKGVEQQELTANPEEFTSQEELLSYLQSFEILNEDDASFILKVTQTLTDALVEYRQQSASNKDHLEAEYNEEAALECSTEQSDPTSADVSDSDTDYSSSRSAKQSLSVNGGDEPQNFSTGSSDAAYENNVMTEFLNSVRNMNVEEVTATLHKIAAANPAFRGIDIPNVIRILAESGTLRRPSNGSTQ